MTTGLYNRFAAIPSLLIQFSYTCDRPSTQTTIGSHMGAPLRVARLLVINDNMSLIRIIFIFKELIELVLWKLITWLKFLIIIIDWRLKFIHDFYYND